MSVLNALFRMLAGPAHRAVFGCISIPSPLPNLIPQDVICPHLSSLARSFLLHLPTSPPRRHSWINPARLPNPRSPSPLQPHLCCRGRPLPVISLICGLDVPRRFEYRCDLCGGIFGRRLDATYSSFFCALARWLHRRRHRLTALGWIHVVASWA